MKKMLGVRRWARRQVYHRGRKKQAAWVWREQQGAKHLHSELNRLVEVQGPNA
jgi:hypothetical protein